MTDLDRRFTSARGVGLHWLERGHGRPMLLLHGMADSHLAWLPLAQRLPDRRLVVVDLPGHGLSDRPDVDHEPGWYASVVADFVDRLGLEDVDLVGHSYGGAVAQHLLLTHRERVRSVTLLAPGGWGREVGLSLHALRLLPPVLLQPLLGLGTRMFMKPLSPEHAAHSGWLSDRPSTARALVRTARSAVDRHGQRMLATDFAGELTDLPPTLMVWGDRDRVIPVSHAYRAAAWLSGLELRIYRGCGHFPHLERTDELARDLGTFIAETRAPIRMAMPEAMIRPSWLRRTGRAVGRFFARLFGRRQKS